MIENKPSLYINILMLTGKCSIMFRVHISICNYVCVAQNVYGEMLKMGIYEYTNMFVKHNMLTKSIIVWRMEDTESGRL